MSLLLVYSDWGEVDVGWGHGHLGLSFTAQPVNSRNPQRQELGRRHKCPKACQPLLQTKRFLLTVWQWASLTCRGAGPCLLWQTKPSSTVFGAWMKIWFLSLHPFSPSATNLTESKLLLQRCHCHPCEWGQENLWVNRGDRATY